MGIRMSLNEARLLEDYEKLMDKIYLQYFTYPTNIPHYNLTDAENAEMSEYDAMGQALANQYASHRKTRSKKTIFHFDPNYCNGLPRKR